MNLLRIVGPGDGGRVLGSFLKTELRISSRLMKKLKTRGLISVNGAMAYTNRILAGGDAVRVALDALATEPETIAPEDIPLDILYEDDALIAINKQAGRIIHPSVVEGTGTIANALAAYYERTGCRSHIHPISRLDRDTTGVILFAKDSYTGFLAADAISRGAYIKQYLGVVSGEPDPPAGLIDLPLGRVEGSIMLRAARCEGKPSRTYYETLRSARGMSLLRLMPATGRTHQLRAHLSAIGYHLVCDGLYGPDGPSGTPPERRGDTSANGRIDAEKHADMDMSSEVNARADARADAAIPAYACIARQALHSWKLTFQHPHTGEPVTVTGSPPRDFAALLAYMGVNNIFR